VNCEGPIVPEGVIRARAVNCEGPFVPEGVIIRARAVNCEGPIVPEGVIRARAVNCEGPIVPEGVIMGMPSNGMTKLQLCKRAVLHHRL